MDVIDVDDGLCFFMLLFVGVVFVGVDDADRVFDGEL